MARLVGVDLPRNKRLEVALTYIYGIGPARAAKILEKTGISPDLRTDDLTEDDIRELRNALSEYNIEGDLRREVAMNIKRLQEINSYRGMRHKRGLLATSCSCVSFCSLTSARKTFFVSHTSERVDFLKTFDVHSDFTS